MVGLEVSPVIDHSSIYRLRVPWSSRSRVLLSSQRLCPLSCSDCGAFMVSPRAWNVRIHDIATGSDPAGKNYARDFCVPHGDGVLWFTRARGETARRAATFSGLCFRGTIPLGIDSLGTWQQDFALLGAFA